MILSDKFFKEMGTDLINPFVDHLVRVNEHFDPIISYGLSSYGYDVRCSDEFALCLGRSSEILDPKNIADDDLTRCVNHSHCIIPPNSFALTRTIEYIKVPKNMIGICVGKSTYARCGIVANITPLEPEWEGHITIELSNTTPRSVKIYANEGIAQIIFFKNYPFDSCTTSYKDRKGKYQGQTGITLAKV